MDNTILVLLALSVYHLVFFFKDFYFKPFRMATGEFLSTFFPHWIWMGRELRRRRLPLTDHIYYQFPGCIPFLSTFYPFHIVTSFLSTFLRLDNAFVLLEWLVLSHYILGSVLAYFVFSSWTSTPIALFGALSVTYAAYMIKPQNPCVVYSMMWMPGMLLDGPMSGISFGMAILGGYWPTLLYFAPVAILAQIMWHYEWWWLGLGFLIGLPQIIPFLWYWPKSVRAKKTENPGTFGSVPISRFLDLIFPNRKRTFINGVLYPESAMYIGLLPLAFLPFGQSGFWMILAIAFLGMIGLFKGITPRIPARFTHLFSFSLVWIATSGLNRLNLSENWLWTILILQGWDLLKNSEVQPLWPFTEWWKKPSTYWGARLGQDKVSAYNPRFPYFTGYITETMTPGYTGGFALQAMHDKYGITNPNGERVKHFA